MAGPGSFVQTVTPPTNTNKVGRPPATSNQGTQQGGGSVSLPSGKPFNLPDPVVSTVVAAPSGIITVTQASTTGTPPNQVTLTFTNQNANGVLAGPASGAAAAPTFRKLTHADVPDKPLFDHYADAGNVGSTETNLYSDSLAAGQLAANGDKLFAKYAFILTTASNCQPLIKIYFGGNLILSSFGPLAIGPSWAELDLFIIRDSATTVRAVAKIVIGGTQGSDCLAIKITGLTLSGAVTLLVTGQAIGSSAANNTVVAISGEVEYKAAA
jgi:hypothetical protein